MTKIDYSDSNDKQSIFKTGGKGNRFYAKDNRLYFYYNNVQGLVRKEEKKL